MISVAFGGAPRAARHPRPRQRCRWYESDNLALPRPWHVPPARRAFASGRGHRSARMRVNVGRCAPKEASMVKRWPTLPPGDRGLGCGAHHADGPRRRWVRESLEGQLVDPHHGLGRRGLHAGAPRGAGGVVTIRGGSADPGTQAVYAVGAGATREALGGHVTAQRPCRFLFGSPPPHQTGHSVTCRDPITHSPFGDPAARVHPRGRCRTPRAAPLGVRLSRRCRQLPRGLPAVRRFGPAAGQPVRGHRSELRCPDRGESQ